MAKWSYSLAQKTYIDAAGNPMSQATLHEVRDQYLAGMDDLLDAYADNLASEEWSISRVETEMRRRLKDAYIAEYTLGKGGVSQMGFPDYGRLGAMLKRQYKFLRGYLDDLEAGRETHGSAGQRMKNFIGSARQAMSRGRGQAWEVDLPVHPGDGGTPCHGNCRCHWEIEEKDTEIHAFWRTSGDACTGCRARASDYSPYVMGKVLNA